MFRFNGLPAEPGSLEPTDDLRSLLSAGKLDIDTGQMELGKSARHWGALLLRNVKPPTPLRVVEVAFPLVQDQAYPIEHQIDFMVGILAGAMEEASKRSS